MLGLVRFLAKDTIDNGMEDFLLGEVCQQHDICMMLTCAMTSRSPGCFQRAICIRTSNSCTRLFLAQTTIQRPLSNRSKKSCRPPSKCCARGFQVQASIDTTNKFTSCISGPAALYIGPSVVDESIAMIFEPLQSRMLNKQLLYRLIDQLLEEMFPESQTQS